MQTIKCVIIGDSGVGKTSLLNAFAHNAESKSIQIDSSGSACFFTEITVEGNSITLGVVDTKRDEDSDRLRPLAYPPTDVFLICFSIVSPPSYENVKNKWYPEISCHIPGAQIILVGTKLELREDEAVIERLRDRRMAPIQYAQGVAMSKEIRARKYLECSDLAQEGVGAVFDEAVWEALNPLRERGGGGRPSGFSPWQVGLCCICIVFIVPLAVAVGINEGITAIKQAKKRRKVRKHTLADQLEANRFVVEAEFKLLTQNMPYV